MKKQRRQFLQALSAGSIGLIAGCTGGDDSADTTSETGTQEETTTGDSTETESTETSSGGTQEVTPESVIHQTAGGEDIWDKTDKGHFFYTEQSGDFDVRVNVYSVEQGVNEYAKAGIMFRNSMDPGDVHVMTRRAPSGNSNVQWRPEKGAEAGSLTSDIGEGKAQLDNYFWPWHRLVRKGDTVEFHVSSDGEEWQLMATLTGDDVALGDGGFLGLAATSHNRAQKANFYYQGLEGVTPTEAGDLGGPIVPGSVEILDEMPSDVKPPEKPEPAANKIAHFTFDGDQITDTVSGNTGSMGGGVETGVSGKVDSAFKFNGEDGYATFPATGLDAEQATVTGWFNVSEHQEWSRVMQAGGSYEASPGETNGGWDLGFEGPTANLAVTTYGSQKVRPTKHEIEYDTWYFVAVVFDGANVALHLYDESGEVAVVENEQKGRGVNAEAPITFFAGDTNYTAGMIDDVRGFDGPLSKDKIQSIYEE
ncbi:LamG-like jellyroll fold domain-containing protein [Haloarchaeobius sp. DFWS5]|uniref:LamG-like jellyroll fold domain-containing protein n=1 Tax=Haloarchaeobius sp. DFWS5 TaxID=3446114 RepID=UPI003EBCDD9C